MSPGGIAGEIARFDGFELIVSTAELRNNDGSRTRLSEQTFRILLTFLERPSELVTRENLRNRLWPNDTVVEFEHGISAAMNRLRQALGDSAENPRFIETLARKGYRWKTMVEWVNVAPELPATRVAAKESLSGQKVSHYRVLEILGGGGMGVVYRAEDMKLGRPVALKFLPDELVDDPLALQRFKREARAASSLNHPNVCTIHAIDEHEGKHFIVMELLEGKTLRDWIAEIYTGAMQSRPNPFPVAACVQIAIQIADGLSAAHNKGLIHRDIKPANIMLTGDGRIKILDFGLAKLQDIEYVDESRRKAAFDNTHSEGHPDRTLTRTGLAIGTAGYMSPEQIRGERLDARTDIFSFGLVLYEMATGRRAFTGDPAPLLQAAILESTPKSVQELNPGIDPDLVRIINRALQKDRDARYQTVAEMLVELQNVSRKWLPGWLRAKLTIPIASAVVLATIVLGWYLSRSDEVRPVREFRQRQLTASSSDDPVTGAAISPDGKYLAYTDLEGIHLKLVESGEMQSVSVQHVSEGRIPTWEIGSWMPDSTHFFAIAELPDEPISLWSIPVAGGNGRMIAQDAELWSVSPDGSSLAVTRNDEHEVWLVDPNGEHARKLWDSGNTSTFRALQWSPDGTRLAYIRSKLVDGKSEAQIESRDVKSGSPVVLLSGTAARQLSQLQDSYRDMDWLPDGRLVFPGGEPDIRGISCNLWQAHVDPQTGRFTSDPQRITNWAGFAVNTFSNTADSRKFVFARRADLLLVYAARLDRAKFRLGDLTKLAYTEDLSSPAGWTHDGTAVYIRSNREGSWGIYKQPLNGGPAEPMVTRLANVSRSTPESPDGKWLLYTMTDSPDPTAPVRILRIPSGGGSAQEIARGRFDKVLCSQRVRTQCVVADRPPDRKSVVFSEFDPAVGKGRELATFENEQADQFGWDLAPDGTKVVLHRNIDSSFKILPLGRGAGLKDVQINVNNGTRLSELFWDFDGNGLFASAPSEHGAELVYVDLEGKVRPLWELRGTNVFLAARPFPDGRYLAIQGSAGSSNMWLLEDF